MASGNKDIKELGRQSQFSKENQPSGRGRKKRGEIVKEMVGEYGDAMTLSDVRELARLMWSLSATELNEMGLRQTQFPIVMNFINKLLNGTNKDKIWLLEWAFGKAKQDIELNTMPPVVLLKDNEMETIEKLKK